MRQTLLLAVMRSAVFLQAVHRCERMLQTLFLCVRADQKPSQSELPKRAQFERRGEELMEKVA